MLTALTNNRQFNTLVVPKAIIDEKKVKKTKKILAQLYPNASFSSSSTRDIYDVAIAETKALLTSCRNFMNLNYPFNDAFEEIVNTLAPLERLTSDTLFDEVPSMENTLLDLKENFIDPVMEFMNGDKRTIYDSVIEYVRENRNNLRYIESEDKAVLEELSSVNKPYLGKFIVNAKQALSKVENLLKPLIEQTQKDAVEAIEKVIVELQENENFEKVP